MAAKSPPIQIKFAIYGAMLQGGSARQVATRFEYSHPTAVKYAEEAIGELREMPAVQAEPELKAFLAGNVRVQCYAADPAIVTKIMTIIAPMVAQADELASAPKEGPTVSISARVPESLFFQFKRLSKVLATERDAEVTISSLVNELIEAFVESGRPLQSDVKFSQSDLLMDDMRALLARHGMTKD